MWLCGRNCSRRLPQSSRRPAIGPTRAQRTLQSARPRAARARRGGRRRRRAVVPQSHRIRRGVLGDAARRNAHDTDQLAADRRRGGLHRERLRRQGIHRGRALSGCRRARRRECAARPVASRGRRRNSGLRELRGAAARSGRHRHSRSSAGKFDALHVRHDRQAEGRVSLVRAADLAQPGRERRLSPRRRASISSPVRCITPRRCRYRWAFRSSSARRSC